MALRFLLNADSLESINPYWDSGVFLTSEILARGHSLDYCDLSAQDFNRPNALVDLKVQNIKSVNPEEQRNFWNLDEPRSAQAHQYDVILQRKDPPVDAFYLLVSETFSKLPERILQINNPRQTTKYSEHAIILEFEKYCVPTKLCHSISEFVSAVQSFDQSVAKPDNTMGGVGIEFYKQDSSEIKLEEYWQTWGHMPVTVQKFIEGIPQKGDLRILTMNKVFLGAVLRLPPTGRLLANLHQGGSVHSFTPTPKQMEAVTAICEKLNPRGFYLLGMDFLGDYLSEINFTCPTLLKQINQLYPGVRSDKIFLDQIEILVKERTLK